MAIQENRPEYEDGYVFQPENYPDYRSIEDQIAVLQGLGFEVPETAADYYHDWMDDSEYGKFCVEGHPFYVLLSDIGTPHYDADTYEFRDYSAQAYWFDFESWDLAEDYLRILKGVEAQTGGETTFVGAREDCEDVDWNRGTGTIHITFWCRGTPYAYEAKVENDWIDPGFIGFLNKVLDAEGYEENIYACGDNGQGNILFYRDQTWAEEFMGQTGLTLSLEAQ